MKTRNPYRATFDTLNRFRGLWQKAGRFNIDKAYTPDSNNAVSTKIGQLDSREGQHLDSTYTDSINNADHFLTVKFINEGNNIHAEAVQPVAVYGIPAYSPPTTWNPPPWMPPTSQLNTCQDWWDLLSTPVGEQKAGGVFPDCFTSTLYTCEDLWERTSTPLEYRKSGGVFPDCTQTPPPPPDAQYTCADVWPYSPNLADFEIAANADSSIADGYDDCWEMTCQDWWDKYPTLSTYEISANANAETIETGGNATIADCWDTAFNCIDLYAMYPDLDEYRVTNPLYPECWDISVDPPIPTCQEYWDLYSVDIGYRKAGGVFPDCTTLPPIKPPIGGSCTSRMWYFPTSGDDSITWDISTGYEEDNTTTLLDFNVEASVYSGEIGNSLQYVVDGPFKVQNEQWFYDYENIDPPCRRDIFYGVNVQVEEGLEEGIHTGRITFYVTLGDFINVPYVVTLKATVTAGFNYEDLWNTYDQRLRMVSTGRLPAYETYDFTDYQTRVDFIASAQEWIDNRNPQTHLGFMRYHNQTGIEATKWTDLRYTGSRVKADAGVNVLGFKRAEGVYGTIQTGDTIEQFHFDELDQCFRQLRTAIETLGGINGRGPAASSTTGPLQQFIYSYPPPVFTYQGEVDYTLGVRYYKSLNDFRNHEFNIEVTNSGDVPIPEGHIAIYTAGFGFELNRMAEPIGGAGPPANNVTGYICPTDNDVYLREGSSNRSTGDTFQYFIRTTGIDLAPWPAGSEVYYVYTIGFWEEADLYQVIPDE